MKTEIIDIAKDNEYALVKSQEILSAGGIVIFPTETIYGIGCDLFNNSSIRKIYELKQRDYQKPLSAYIDKASKAETLAIDIPESYYRLAHQFLPGPLTIILRAKANIAKSINSLSQTVAIRIPANDFLLQLLSQYDNPIAGTSANLSNTESSLHFEDALKPFVDKIELALKDEKSIKSGIASTVISLVDDSLKILRLGTIKKEEIEECLKLKL